MDVEKNLQSVTLIDRDYINPLGYVVVKTNPVDPSIVVLDLSGGARCILGADKVFVESVCSDTPAEKNLGIDPNDFLTPYRLESIHLN